MSGSLFCVWESHCSNTIFEKVYPGSTELLLCYCQKFTWPYLCGSESRPCSLPLIYVLIPLPIHTAVITVVSIVSHKVGRSVIPPTFCFFSKVDLTILMLSPFHMNFKIRFFIYKIILLGSCSELH